MCRITENDCRTIMARLDAKLKYPPYFDGDLQAKQKRLQGWRDGLEHAKTFVAFQIRPGSLSEREYHRLQKRALRMAESPPYALQGQKALEVEGWKMSMNRFSNILTAFWQEKLRLEEQMRPWYEEEKR